MSRSRPCRDVLIDFAQNGVEFASGNIALHLLIPLITFPTVQPCSEIGLHAAESSVLL